MKELNHPYAVGTPKSRVIQLLLSERQTLKAKADLHDELVDVIKEVAKFKFSFDKRDLDNGAYKDEIRTLQKNVKNLLDKIQQG